jgi:hypothetical protein
MNRPESCIDGQKSPLKIWHAQTRSASSTGLAIDFFETQAKFLTEFIQRCSQTKPDPAITLRQSQAVESLHELEWSIIPQLKKCLVDRKKYLFNVVTDVKHEHGRATLQQLQGLQSSIDSEIEKINHHLFCSGGLIERRNTCLATINKFPGLLAAYERFDKNGAGWINRLWDEFSEHTQQTIPHDLEEAKQEIGNIEEQILNQEAQLEVKQLIKSCNNDLIANCTKMQGIIQGTFNLPAQYSSNFHDVYLSSDGYVVGKGELPEQDIFEREFQEKFYSSQKEHIESSWLKLLSIQESVGKLPDIQQARLTALEKTIQTNGARSLVNFVMTPEIEQVLASFDVALGKFKVALLNDYQLQLAQERVEIINKAFQLKVDCAHKPELAPIAPVVTSMCDDAMYMALVAEDCNRLVLLKESELFTDCANTFLKYAQLPIKGCVQGLEHVVTTYCPRLGRAFFDPVTAGKQVASWAGECAQQVGSLLAEILREEARTELLIQVSRTNQPAAQTLLDQQLAQQAVFDNAIKETIEHLKTLTGEQIVLSFFKEVTKLTADTLIFHYIGSCIKNTASNTRIIVDALKSSYGSEEVETLFMQTPEGFNFRVSREFNNEMQCSAEAEKAALSGKEIIKVKNMQDFFSNTTFGQTLKNKCRSTKRFYNGERIYKVTEEMAGILKKNDYFYLDSRHYHHLEVFSGNHTFKKALSLDGTIYEDGTKRGLGRRIKIN